MSTFEGSCLCGAISYVVEGEPSAFNYCHCRSCRKASGSAFAAIGSVPRDGFRLKGPGDTLAEYESSPGKMRAFCSRCGSPVYAYMTAHPETLRLRMGLLDSDFTGRPQSHIWVSQKPAWDTICDEVPQFEHSGPR